MRSKGEGQPYDPERFDSLPSRERIRKPRREEYETRDTKPRERRLSPSQPPGDVKKREPLATWPVFHELLDSWTDPKQKDLLLTFAINHGPDDVRRYLRGKLVEIRTAPQITMQMQQSMLGSAMSAVFYRLAYHSVEEREKGKVVTGVVDSIQAFRGLRLRDGHFVPQGMIMDESTVPPTLETLCIYRRNSASSYGSGTLKGDLAEAVSFFTELGGQVVRSKREPRQLNRLTGRTIRAVRVAETPNVLLVIPHNHDLESETPFVRVEQSLFSNGAIAVIARSILKDLRVPVTPSPERV